MKNAITDDKKVVKMKEFFSRYKAQRDLVDWQKKKLDDLREILTGDKDDVEAAGFIPDEEIKEAIGWNETERKLEAESVELCKIYRETIRALDLVSSPEQREILYEMYIGAMSIDGVAYLREMHPKTISKKHRAALIELYDILNP